MFLLSVKAWRTYFGLVGKKLLYTRQKKKTAEDKRPRLRDVLRPSKLDRMHGCQKSVFNKILLRIGH